MKSAQNLKFNGGAGALAGAYVTEGGRLLYVLLVGIGAGSDTDLLNAGGKAFVRLNGQNVTTAEFRATYQREAPPPVCSRVRQAADQARARLVLADDTRGAARDGDDIREAMA